MEGKFTFRPFRFAYEVIIFSASIYYFGFWVILPLLLISVDFEPRK